MAAIKHKRTYVKRHWSLRERLIYYSRPSPDGCIIWIGPRNGGYGQMSIRRDRFYAHQIAWEIANGRSIPKGMYVCHRCDVPACVNPDHLFIGTHADNMADMTAKGRRSAPHGRAHPLAKLTDEQALAIFHSSEPQTVLARKFGVSQPIICGIKKKKCWPHIHSLPE